VFALVVAWIPLRKQVGRARGLSLRAGLRAVRAASPLVTVTAVLAPIGLLGMNLSVFAPIVAHDVLDLGAVGFGLVTSAAGAGALLAGVVLVRLNRAGVKSFLGGALTLAVGLILVAASRETVVALTGFFVFGIGLTTTLASARTLFQRLAPPEAEGTALGVYTLLAVGTTPLGSVLVGALTSAAGIRATLAGLGTGCVVTAAAGLTVARRRRQLDVEVRRGAVTAAR
jgi:MFS-type transporter involved in bile tolerance (Atg22 family)